LLLQQLKWDSEAEAVLCKTLRLEPKNMDFLYAVAQLCLNGGRPEKAKPIADKMLDLYPNQRIGQDLLTHVDQISKRGTRLEPFGLQAHFESLYY